MKSSLSMYFAAVTLFAALAVPLWTVAQGAPSRTSQQLHYKLIYVVTFGGPQSFVNPPTNSFPAFNARDTTVGWSATVVPAPANCNPIAGCGGFDGFDQFIFHAFKLQQGVISDLISPAAQKHEVCSFYKFAGEIAGVSENGVTAPLSGSTKRKLTGRHQ